MVTGGEDGKINSWPIHPVEELVGGDDADGEELMDVDMSSPIGRKREHAGDNELVRFFFSRVYVLIDIISVIARETSQTLTGLAASQAAHFCQRLNVLRLVQSKSSELL